MNCHNYSKYCIASAELHYWQRMFHRPRVYGRSCNIPEMFHRFNFCSFGAINCNDNCEYHAPQNLALYSKIR